MQSPSHRNDRQMAQTHTHTFTHTPKPVCENKGVTVLWNQGVYTDKELW
jgi:hypothetical protein